MHLEAWKGNSVSLTLYLICAHLFFTDLCLVSAGLRSGGGMHVGPNDPIFSRRFPGNPHPEGPLPGVRYDPVAPFGEPVSLSTDLSFPETNSPIGLFWPTCKHNPRKSKWAPGFAFLLDAKMYGAYRYWCGFLYGARGSQMSNKNGLVGQEKAPESIAKS